MPLSINAYYISSKVELNGRAAIQAIPEMLEMRDTKTGSQRLLTTNSLLIKEFGLWHLLCTMLHMNMYNVCNVAMALLYWTVVLHYHNTVLICIQI